MIVVAIFSVACLFVSLNSCGTVSVDQQNVSDDAVVLPVLLIQSSTVCQVLHFSQFKRILALQLQVIYPSSKYCQNTKRPNSIFTKARGNYLQRFPQLVLHAAVVLGYMTPVAKRIPWPVHNLTIIHMCACECN